MTETVTPTPQQEGPRARGRWIAIGAIILGVGILVFVFGGRFGVDPGLVDSPLIGKPVPAIELAELDGEGTYSLDGFPDEVVVVNFWASWCFPCRGEHPHLTAAARDYADLGVRFVGVVYQDEPGNAMGFLDQLGWGDGYLYVLDPDSRAAVEFGVFGVPETFVIDRDGTIVHKFTGPVDSFGLRTALDANHAGVENPEI
jgi:cytochrome c biogenesis protein CcmG/thiol:disulfide interchange protein DsbE